MRHLLILLVAVWSFAAPGAFSQQTSAEEQPKPAEEAGSAPETEVVAVPQPSPVAPPPLAGEAGYLEPDQARVLLHNLWLAIFRLNDLLGEVRPDQWNLGADQAGSLAASLEDLRGQLAKLEEWRSRFEQRPGSIHLGYETYVAIDAALPSLEALVQSVNRYENASFAAQYAEAKKQLVDLQQAIRPYLSHLLRNQDQLLLASETNLAACHNQLGLAMRSAVPAAKPMRNQRFIRPKPRRAAQTVEAGGNPLGRNKTTGNSEAKPEAAKQPEAATPLAPKTEGAEENKAGKNKEESKQEGEEQSKENSTQE